MTISVEEHLRMLRQYVKDATVRGSFLLSTGEVSNYWISVDRLRSYDVSKAVGSILRVCLPRFQLETNVGTVFVPQFTTTSEDDLPLDPILHQLRDDDTFNTERSLSFCNIGFDRHRKEVRIPEGTDLGVWLGVFALSVHADTITAILDTLRRRKRVVNHILVLVERERFTREELQRRGIHLVPMIVCNEETGEPQSVLDIARPPYTTYHHYFVPGRSVSYLSLVS